MHNPRVARHLREQAGAIARRQALDAGATTDQIAYLLRTGAWSAALPSVYVAADAPAAATRDLWVAWLWAGRQAILSHGSAARIWRLDAVAADTDRRPELWVPPARHVRSPSVVTHRSVDPVPSRVQGGLRVTTPERTLVDLAPRLSDHRLERAVESARLERLVSLASLRRTVDGIGTRGRSGAGRLSRLLAYLDERPAESALEVAVARLLRHSRLPAAVRQHEIVVGRSRYRLDFAWPDRRVALECDGRRHHSDAAAFRRDRARWTEITAGACYRIVFATWRDATTRPGWIVEQVGAALGGARYDGS
jgi:very-short-patch-repair endonuclease